jgi:hypothetical protein
LVIKAVTRSEKFVLKEIIDIKTKKMYADFVTATKIAKNAQKKSLEQKKLEVLPQIPVMSKARQGRSFFVSVSKTKFLFFFQMC